MEITVIREENQSIFEPFMPEEMWTKTDLVLGAVDKGHACGVVAVSEEDTLFNIQYIYVAEEYRRKGVATSLLEGIHQVAEKVYMDGVYCQFAEKDDTEALQNCFAKNLFMRDTEDSPIYKTQFKDLPEKVFHRDIQLSKSTIEPLEQVTAKTWNELLEKLNDLSEEEGTVPELDVKYIYDQKTSFLLKNRSEVKGCILFEKQEDSYILSYFCMLGDANALEMMGLFKASYLVMEQECSPDTEIYINALTQTTEKMVQELTGGKAQKLAQAASWYYVY